MLKHGCDDIRVVYLTACTEFGAEQGKEAVQDGRAVFGYLEDLLETLHIRDRGSHRQWEGCGLRPGHHSQVLA